MHKPLSTTLGLLAASSLLASGAHALDFSSGDVDVQGLTEFGFIAAGGTPALSFDGGTTDEVYENFGYIGNNSGMVRVDATNFDAAAGFTNVGNTATADLSLNSTGASELGLTAGDILITHTFTLIDDTGIFDADVFWFEIEITNDSGSGQSFRYYNYLDADVGGTSDYGDDTATGDQNRIAVVDLDDAASAITWKADAGANRYEVNRYATLRNKLDSATRRINLSNSGAPFGPADFTGAKQINENLADGDVSFVRFRIAKGPEPGTGLLLGFGLALVGVQRRTHRRRRAARR